MSGPGRATIDLNADVGEGGPCDAELVPLVTSANVACGGHAGDSDTMRATIALARRHGVAIGAHPGHADRGRFGREPIAISPAAAAGLVVGQVALLEEAAGEPPRHVKLHGGLYHQAARDERLAEAVATAVANRWPAMILFAPAGSRLVAVARGLGLVVAEEAFVDRAYLADGSLVPRSRSDALIADPAEAARRAVGIVRDGAVAAGEGGSLRLRADTLCIHGDGPGAAAIAAAVRTALLAAGIGLERPRG